jgi:hypothetical protein
MDVVPFLEYLHERIATSELAESLAQVLVLRNRSNLVPTELAPCVIRQVAS